MVQVMAWCHQAPRYSLITSVGKYLQYICGITWLQWINSSSPAVQGWGEYYSGTRLAQNDKHECTKNIVLEYYSSTDFPVLVLVCWVLAPALLLSSYFIWELGQNGFGWWLVACLSPGLCLSRWRRVVHWTLRNELQWNLHWYESVLSRALVDKRFCVLTWRLALNVMTCRYVLSLNKCNLFRCYSSCRQGHLCFDVSFIPKCHDISTHIVVDKSTGSFKIIFPKLKNIGNLVTDSMC